MRWWIFLTLALLRCAEPEPTLVRMHNASTYTLEGLQVTFRDRRVDYGRLGPGETSGYKRADGAYRYAYMEASVNGERFILQPIDFVGETPLGPGRFTYRLTVMPERRALIVERTTGDE